MSAGLYSTFTVADRYLGVPVERVQEVLRAQPITPVPLAHDHIEGLLNMRGQIVTALNLRARLGLPPREPDAPSANVIVMTEDGPLSLGRRQARRRGARARRPVRAAAGHVAERYPASDQGRLQARRCLAAGP